MREYILNFIDELKYERNYSQFTVDNYLNDLDLFLEYINEHEIKDYNDVDYQNIREYISYLYELKYSNKTISRRISALKSFFKYLNSKQIIKNNPMILITSPKIEKKLPKFLNYEDTEKFEMLYSTGIRVSEISNIKLKEISLSDKTIKITGKGNKERIVYFGTKCNNLIKKYLKESYPKLNIKSL